MNDPLRQLKQLPWLPLLLVALLTMFWASVLELILWFSSTYISLINSTLIMLYSPPLNVVMELAVSMGLGALAVIFLEIAYSNLMINSGVLWALLLCLTLGMLFRSILPVPTVFLSPTSPMLIGNMLGIFLKGKPYWR